MLAETNGTIQIASGSAAGGTDDDGNPIQTGNWTYGNKIPCHYTANKYEHTGSNDGGKFTMAKFIILIDIDTTFNAQYVVLNDLNGNRILSEFRVQNIQHLTVVGNTKIQV